MELDCHNIQRRLSPSEPAMLVDPSEMRIVRGPLEANASYGQVVKSPYAIGRSTGKELIPIDVLLAGFSNPTMAGYDHYVTVQSRNKCPTVTDKDDMVYDKDLKTAGSAARVGAGTPSRESRAGASPRQPAREDLRFCAQLSCLRRSTLEELLLVAAREDSGVRDAVQQSYEADRGASSV